MLSLLVLPSILGAGLSLSVTLALWLRKPGLAWRQAALTGVCVAWWCAGQTAWLLSASDSQRLSVAQFQYLGVALAPALWLITALAYVGRSEWLCARRSAALLVIPILTIVAAFTNDRHGLVWRRFMALPGRSQMDIVYGSWFAVHALYSYVATALGSVLLAARFSASPLYRPQLILVLLGPGIVLIMNFLYLTASTALPIDPTPASFAISFFGLAWAMGRHHFFEFLPLARGLTIEGLRDAIIVLDRDDRMVDANPAARAVLAIASANPLGARLRELMPQLDLSPTDGGLPREVALADGRRMQVTITGVTSRSGVSEGAVILLRDVTLERLAQEQLLRAQEKLREANHELEKLALTDSLTGLSNRRRLMGRLDEEFARARRHDRPLCFVMLDLDHFKQVNDTHGHPTGDRVLAALGKALLGLVRPGDVAARLGGEEFGILLPDTSLEEACDAARRLRSVLRGLPHEARDGAPLTVTLSLGVAAMRAADQTPQDVLARADAALYSTKANGRDGITREFFEGFERLS